MSNGFAKSAQLFIGFSAYKNEETTASSFGQETNI
jgi:hypothetical protein